MTLTYVFHSCFVLETEKSILIFDYWLDLNGVVPSFLKKDKPVYVFSSHFHEDHFNSVIFEWRKQRDGITYILSKDIYKHRRATKEDADVWLAKGGTWSDGTLSVWALGSTDSGVSWIVETEGKRIFHAGDLNNWYARFLPEAEAWWTFCHHGRSSRCRFQVDELRGGNDRLHTRTAEVYSRRSRVHTDGNSS